MIILYFHLPYFHASVSALFFTQYFGALHLHRRSLNTSYVNCCWNIDNWTTVQLSFSSYASWLSPRVWITQSWYDRITDNCFPLSSNHLPLHLLQATKLSAKSNCGYTRPGGRFKNTYELLNLRALKISKLHKNHIFQCMGKIFCVEFQRVPLKFHTKYLTHTLKDVDFIHIWRFKSSLI